MIDIQIPDSTDPYVPHIKMLSVSVVAGVVFLDICRVEDTSDTTTRTIVENISVDAQTLVDAIFEASAHSIRDRALGARHHHDVNYDKGSPFRTDRPQPQPSEES